MTQANYEVLSYVIDLFIKSGVAETDIIETVHRMRSDFALQSDAELDDIVRHIRFCCDIFKAC